MAHVFGSLCCFSPQGVVMNGGADDEGVHVGEMPRDPIVGIELLEAECLLILLFPDLESSCPSHALLISC